MNCAIIFIKNKKEAELADTCLLGRPLLDYTVSQLKKLDIDHLYLFGGRNIDNDELIKRDDINELICDIGSQSGRCLLMGPLFPLIDHHDYAALLNNDKPCMASDGEDFLPVFALDNEQLSSFETLSYDAVEIKSENCLKVSSYARIAEFNQIIKLSNNQKHLERGVNIIDPANTYIGPEVMIEKGSVVYPNVTLEGKCIIGRNVVIKSNSFVKDSVVGAYSVLNACYIEDSILGDKVNVGFNTHLAASCEMANGVNIGDFVSLNNCRVAYRTRIDSYVCLDNATVGEEVVIGNGVRSADRDGRRHYALRIADGAWIGAGAVLIGPLNIGAKAVVMAASAIDSDVEKGDMAIARVYQANKKGYGLKYIEEEEI